MREFGVNAENTKNQEHEKNIGLDNAGKKFLPRR